MRPGRLFAGADDHVVAVELEVGAGDAVALFARLEHEFLVGQFVDDLVLARLGHGHDEDELVLGLLAGRGREVEALELMARVGERGQLVLRQVDLELARVLDVDHYRLRVTDGERLAHAILHSRSGAAAGERGLERVELQVARHLGLAVVLAQRRGVGHRVEAAQPPRPALAQVGAIGGVGRAHEQVRARAEQAEDGLARALALGLDVEGVAALGVAGDGDVAIVVERHAARGARTGDRPDVAEVDRLARAEGEAHVGRQMPGQHPRQGDDCRRHQGVLAAWGRLEGPEFVVGVGRWDRLIGHSRSLFQK